jgi:hypothetical protein
MFEEIDAPCGQGVSLGKQHLIVIIEVWLRTTLLGLAETSSKIPPPVKCPLCHPQGIEESKYGQALYCY